MSIIAKTASVHQAFPIHRILQIQHGRRSSSCLHITSCQNSCLSGSVLLRQRRPSLMCGFVLRDIDVLYSRTMSRSVAYFPIHPEKLKQMVKLQACQSLCSVLQSEGYRRRIADILEQQKSYLTDGSVMGIPVDDIKYEHMIDCAQPSRKPFKEDSVDAEEETRVKIIVPPPIKKPMKTTAVSAMLKKKFQRQDHYPRSAEDLPSVKQSTILPLVMEARKKTLEKKKRFRRRTTILPIILKNTYGRKIDDGHTKKSSRKQLDPDTKATEATKGGNFIESGVNRFEKLEQSLKQFNTWTELDRKVRNKISDDQKVAVVEARSAPSDDKSVKSEDQNPKTDTQLSDSTAKKANKVPYIPTEDIFSLFQKVKLDTMNKMLPMTDKKSYSVKSSIGDRIPQRESVTYQIVSREKERHKQAERDRYNYEKIRERKCVEIKEVMKVKPDNVKKNHLDLNLKGSVPVN